MTAGSAQPAQRATLWPTRQSSPSPSPFHLHPPEQSPPIPIPPCSSSHLRMSLTAVVLEAWGPPVAMAALISSLYILQGQMERSKHVELPARSVHAEWKTPGSQAVPRQD